MRTPPLFRAGHFCGNTLAERQRYSDRAEVRRSFITGYIGLDAETQSDADADRPACCDSGSRLPAVQASPNGKGGRGCDLAAKGPCSSRCSQKNKCECVSRPAAFEELRSDPGYRQRTGT